MEFWSGYLCGAGTFSWFGWRLYRNLSGRIVRIASLKALSNNLENRRDAIEFGQDQLTPPGAGPAGQENVLFRVRPGALETNRRQLARESLVRQPISATLDNVVEDHSEITNEG